LPSRNAASSGPARPIYFGIWRKRQYLVVDQQRRSQRLAQAVQCRAQRLLRGGAVEVGPGVIFL
jgi:hypothetical protein